MSILYLEHKNHGVSYTKNRGIHTAKAEWIALAVWMAGAVETLKVLPKTAWLCKMLTLDSACEEYFCEKQN